MKILKLIKKLFFALFVLIAIVTFMCTTVVLSPIVTLGLIIFSYIFMFGKEETKKYIKDKITAMNKSKTDK